MKLREKVFGTLSDLKLSGMATALEQQLSSSDFDDMDFLSRLEDLLDHEANASQNRRKAYLLKAAKLRFPDANLATFKYHLVPSLKPAKLKELGRLNWIKHKHHILLIGPTGNCKTLIACALAQAAIAEGIPVLYFRYSELLLHLVSAHKNEKLIAFKRRLNKTPVVIIDDVGIKPMDTLERTLLFELIESRDGHGSWIMTSQYAANEWHHAFQDPTLADATLDRIVHQAHTIALNDDSVRKRLGLSGENS